MTTTQSLLEKALADHAQLLAHACIYWKLTARRVAFDYSRVESAAGDFERHTKRAQADGLLKAQEAAQALALIGKLLEVSGRLRREADRSLKNGKDLSVFATGDIDGPATLDKLLAQEVQGDQIILDRLQQVGADPFSAIYQKAEFLSMRNFYQDQPAVLASFSQARRRFSQITSRVVLQNQKVTLALLRKNVRVIEKRLARVLTMFD